MLYVSTDSLLLCRYAQLNTQFYSWILNFSQFEYKNEHVKEQVISLTIFLVLSYLRFILFLFYIMI